MLSLNPRHNFYSLLFAFEATPMTFSFLISAGAINFSQSLLTFFSCPINASLQYCDHFIFAPYQAIPTLRPYFLILCSTIPPPPPPSLPIFPFLFFILLRR